jgi:CheY-like chemotaxis protein
MRQQTPDVLILDMMFPDTDGYSLLEAMKSDPALANVPVIVASASGVTDELTPALEGRLVLDRASGFQPAELVRYVEALVEVLNPANEPARPEIQPG